jgi:hypothetical protein
MPSFDITSEVDMVALRNAVEGANRKITGRYDFKGTDARVEQADKLLTLYGDSEFQLEQIQTLLLPEMTAKKIDVRCLKHGDIQKVSGNKVKQELGEGGHRAGAVQEDRQAHQGQQAQGAGLDPGRGGARQWRQARPPAGLHRPGAQGDHRFPLQYGNFRD